MDDPLRRPPEELDTDADPFARFAQVASRMPGRIAVDDGNCRLTYAQLARAACGLAERIATAVPPHGLVAILVPIDARFPVAMLACLLARRAFAPIDPAYPAAYIQASLQVGRPRCAIAAPDADPVALGDLPIIPLPTLRAEDIPQEMPTFPDLPARGMEGVGIVLFTSGSTGEPKGVALPTRILLRLASWMRRHIGLGCTDRMLPLQSFCTSVGLMDAFAAIVTGAGLRIAHLRSAGLGEVETALRHGGVTVVSMVPSVLRALLRLPDAAGLFASVRLLRLSGEPVLDGDVAAARAVMRQDADFLITLGATELVGILARIVPAEERLEPGPVPIGLPYDDIRVTLEDADGRDVAPGEEGLLTVRGRAVAYGYWNAGELDRSAFPDDPDWPGARILRTGDLFRRREDGVFRIIGRADRQVKINGIRVEPGQTESVLRAQHLVEDAAVLARHMPTGPQLVAFAALAPGAPEDAVRGLRRALAERLPPVQRPARLHVLAEIPRLAGFKIDQTTLLRLDDSALADAAMVPLAGADPDDPAADPQIVAAVRRAWTRVLGHAPPNDGIAFDADGGDSLGLLQLIFHVEKDLTSRLRPELHDLGMGVAALAHSIAAQLRGGIDPEAEAPLVIMLTGVGGIGPQVARFRAACAPDLDLRLLDYGDWHEWLGPEGFDGEIVLDRLEAAVAALVPSGPVRLAGYSLGGLIAYWLATRLAARGRNIAFLGLLDTNTNAATRDGPPQQRPWHGEVARLWQPAAQGGGADGLAAVLARLMVSRLAMPALVARARRQPASNSSSFGMLLRLRLNRELIYMLAHRWRRRQNGLGRLEHVPVTLFRCADRLGMREPDDLGWRAHCPALAVVAIGGTHGSLMTSPHLEGLRETFVSTVGATLR